MIAPNGLFPINRLKNDIHRIDNIASIRSLSRSTYLGNNQAVCRVLGQFMIFVNTLDERLGVQLQMNGFWEMNVTEFIARQVKSGMHVVDLGANYGYYSILMAALAGLEGKVHAIEANPMLSELLLKSCKVNGVENRVNIINKGVSGQKAEDIEFVFSDDTPMNGMLAENLTENARLKRFPKTVNVSVDSLDNMLMNEDPVDFIKIDIEGSEDKFWYGSQAVRNKNPKMMILMEFNRARYNNVEKFIRQIYFEGYTVTKLGDKLALYEEISVDGLLTSDTSHHMMLAITKK